MLAQRGKGFEDQVEEVWGFELVLRVGGVLLDSQLLWYLSEAAAEAIFDSVEQPWRDQCDALLCYLDLSFHDFGKKHQYLLFELLHHLWLPRIISFDQLHEGWYNNLRHPSMYEMHLLKYIQQPLCTQWILRRPIIIYLVIKEFQVSRCDLNRQLHAPLQNLWLIPYKEVLSQYLVSYLSNGHLSNGLEPIVCAVPHLGQCPLEIFNQLHLEDVNEGLQIEKR